MAWAGAALFGTMVLLPLGSKFSPSGRAEFAKLVVPTSYRYGLMMGIVALADGAVLYYYINFIGPSSEATSALGDPLIRAGAILGLVGLIIFTWFQDSTMKKMGKLSSQMSAGSSAPSQSSISLMNQMASLQKRSALGARIGVFLLFFVIILMLVGSNIS